MGHHFARASGNPRRHRFGARPVMPAEPAFRLIHHGEKRDSVHRRLHDSRVGKGRLRRQTRQFLPFGRVLERNYRPFHDRRLAQPLVDRSRLRSRRNDRRGRRYDCRLAVEHWPFCRGAWLSDAAASPSRRHTGTRREVADGPGRVRQCQPRARGGRSRRMPNGEKAPSPSSASEDGSGTAR